ncbi:hypothetical protein [Microbacterium sp. 77mftsu3.1]|uniref:hypothetical protein n=1 Tax=Microbacterium sp. 77mftsu3.1 TaxID=1761802 RepID=UPI00037A3ED2|nr:hypothetical protein [Microbacterium sp. 77mftsu3.1]SDH55416.1 hypothetical protein SAMN04488590_3561 [Microbacterium sp. 77mftsu3.1]
MEDTISRENTYAFGPLESTVPSTFLPLIGQLVRVMRPPVTQARTRHGLADLPVMWATGVLESVHQVDENELVFIFRGGLSISAYPGSYIQLEAVEQ